MAFFVWRLGRRLSWDGRLHHQAKLIFLSNEIIETVCVCVRLRRCWGVDRDLEGASLPPGVIVAV